jgi:hypothetical protein
LNLTNSSTFKKSGAKHPKYKTKTSKIQTYFAQLFLKVDFAQLFLKVDFAPLFLKVECVLIYFLLIFL